MGGPQPATRSGVGFRLFAVAPIGENMRPTEGLGPVAQQHQRLGAGIG